MQAASNGLQDCRAHSGARWGMGGGGLGGWALFGRGPCFRETTTSYTTSLQLKVCSYQIEQDKAFPILQLPCKPKVTKRSCNNGCPHGAREVQLTCRYGYQGEFVPWNFSRKILHAKRTAQGAPLYMSWFDTLSPTWSVIAILMGIRSTQSPASMCCNRRAK